MPVSILDTDLYKLTMQQAVLQCFPSTRVEYKFINRRPDQKLSRAAFDYFQSSLEQLSKISLTSEERSWLEKKFEANFVPVEDPSSDLGDLELHIKGFWSEVILYEVPLMALVSESYFLHVDTNWEIDGTMERAKEKGKRYIENSIAFSEFGSRRRRSYKVHDLVIQGLVQAQNEMQGSEGAKNGGRLAGTSNVHFAQKYDLLPVGTIAHEWTMGIAALKGYESANATALDFWEQVYPPSPTSPLHIALTDTFSTPQFLDPSCFTASRARAWKGLRQDSGDPIEYAKRAREAYRALGVDPLKEGKVIVFSDGLDDETPLRIKKVCDDLGMPATFGIGTHFTNDFSAASDPSRQSKALNIVIKLAVIEGRDAVKISDELSKNTGNPETVASVKERLHLLS